MRNKTTELFDAFRKLYKTDGKWKAYCIEALVNRNETAFDNGRPEDLIHATVSELLTTDGGKCILWEVLHDDDSEVIQDAVHRTMRYVYAPEPEIDASDIMEDFFDELLGGTADEN